MKERAILASMNHEVMMTDRRLDPVEIAHARQQGLTRERKGAFAAMREYLQTTKGKALGIAIAASSATTGLGLKVNEEMQRRTDIYAVADASSEIGERDRSLSEIRSDLTEWLGEDQVRDLLPVRESDRDRTAREHRREALRESRVAQVDGLEFAGVKSETFEEYLEEGFPRFMTSRESVSSIRFTREHMPMREDYHLVSGSEAAGTCTVGEGDEPSQIVLYGVLFDERGQLDVPAVVSNVLVHEFAHAIDWENLDALDPADRARMLHQMVSRIRDNDTRLRFDYVEHISTPNKPARLRNQAVEYYAELAASVFHVSARVRVDDQDPFWDVDIARELIRMHGNVSLLRHDQQTEYIRHVVDDVALIRRLVEIYDPDFSWSDAAETRSRLVSQMESDQRITRLHEAAGHISNVVARASVYERLEDMEDQVVSPVSELMGIAHRDERGDTSSKYLSPALQQEAEDLARQIQRIQHEQTKQLESGISSQDMPVYRALANVYELLHQGALDQDRQVNVLRDMILEYAHISLHASPAHLEAARKQAEILMGRHGLSRDLVKRVDDFLSRARA